MNFIDKYRIKSAMKKIGDYDASDILGMFGLERKSIAGDIFADLGFFSLGCICGAAMGVVFAPRAGSEIRRSIRHAVEGAVQGKPTWSGMKESIKPELDHRV
jgi:hypothetical protein